jgi:hypothetical protein
VKNMAVIRQLVDLGSDFSTLNKSFDSSLERNGSDWAFFCGIYFHSTHLSNCVVLFSPRRELQEDLFLNFGNRHALICIDTDV